MTTPSRLMDPPHDYRYTGIFKIPICPPDIPLIQWLHRIAYNQTYWTNWPTEDNLGSGTNGAFWAHTGMLVVTNLEKAE